MSSRIGSRRSRPAPPSADPTAAYPWVASSAGGVVLCVHAQPGAARSRIVGTHGNALKVQIQARPVSGAANRALVTLLADALAVRPAAVMLVAGAQGREKRVAIAGLDVATAVRRLAPFVDKTRGAD